MKHRRSSISRTVRRQRYAASATRRRHLRISHETWRRILLSLLTAAMVIAVALTWGTVLKHRSDEYHAAQANDVWTVGDEKPLVRVDVPEFRGGSLSSDGSVSDFPTDANGAVISLSENADGLYNYVSQTTSSVGLAVVAGAPTLSAEIDRLHKAGLRVLGIFEVQCLNSLYLADPAAAVLRRGIEQSLLAAASQAGIDEILLTGIPCGNTSDDARAVAFLSEVRQLLADSGTALGVALLTETFVREEGETAPDLYEQDAAGEGAPLYTGWRTPGRILSACDYLTLDLRGLSPTDAGEILRGFRFAYVRYSLRLLLSDADTSAYADAHGMQRQVIYVQA